MSSAKWNFVELLIRLGRFDTKKADRAQPAARARQRRGANAPRADAARPRVVVLSLAVLCLIGLVGAVPAYAQTEFVGNWASFGKAYQSAGKYTWRVGLLANQWNYLQAKSASRFLPENDLNSPAGGVVAHVMVKPGDYLGYSGERAEVSYMLGTAGHAIPVTSTSGHEYYAISVKLSSNWVSPGIDPTHQCIWGIFLQLHSPNPYNSPPAIALTAESDFHLNMDTGDLLQGGTLHQYKPNLSYAFSNGTLVRGQWVEFLLDVNWASDNTGWVVVYRRDKGQSNFSPVLSLQNVPTLQTVYGINPGQNYHYWKTGFYRSITPNMTNELWLGPLARGTDVNAVIAAAFPKQN